MCALDFDLFGRKGCIPFSLSTDLCLGLQRLVFKVRVEDKQVLATAEERLQRFEVEVIVDVKRYRNEMRSMRAYFANTK